MLYGLKCVDTYVFQYSDLKELHRNNTDFDKNTKCSSTKKMRLPEILSFHKTGITIKYIYQSTYSTASQSTTK